MARADKPGIGRRNLESAARLGLAPWPDGPWWLLVAAAVAAPFAVLAQGGAPHDAAFAALACLATPSAAIEAMLGLARMALGAVPPGR
jgi:hypothetical protein